MLRLLLYWIVKAGPTAKALTGRSKVFDNLHIPRRVIIRTLEDQDLDRAYVGDAELIYAVRKCFHAQIVWPGRRLRIRARRGESDNPLDQAIVPKLHKLFCVQGGWYGVVSRGVRIKAARPFSESEWVD